MATRTMPMPPTIKPGQEPPETITVKIPRKMHMKLKMIATAKREELFDTIVRLLTTPTDKEYKEVMRDSQP